MTCTSREAFTHSFETCLFRHTSTLQPASAMCCMREQEEPRDGHPACAPVRGTLCLPQKKSPPPPPLKSPPPPRPPPPPPPPSGVLTYNPQGSTLSGTAFSNFLVSAQGSSAVTGEAASPTTPPCPLCTTTEPEGQGPGHGSHDVDSINPLQGCSWCRGPTPSHPTPAMGTSTSHAARARPPSSSTCPAAHCCTR